MNNEVVDFFNEELNKKEKKLKKKKEKELRKKEKKDKKLEKLEDIEFSKKLEEKKLNDVSNLEMTRSQIFDIKDKKKHGFLNFLLGLFLIILFLVSCDYFIYSVLKEKEIEIIITSSLLCCLSIFYILSILIKKESIKKFFQILATISITIYMCYYLFII